MSENETEKRKIEKEKRIKQEKQKLATLFKEMDSSTKKAVDSLINNAAFMATTLQDLQDTINREGTVSEYKNGENQYGTKKSPEVEIYNSMIKNYSSVIKQLTDLLPKKEPVPEDDGFEDFVNSK